MTLGIDTISPTSEIERGIGSVSDAARKKLIILNGLHDTIIVIVVHLIINL